MSNEFYDEVLKIQQEYLPGTRIQIEETASADKGLQPGDKGTVELVDDAGYVFVEWDNGTNSAIHPQKDRIKRLCIDDQIQEAEDKKAELIANKQRNRGKKNRDNERYDDVDRG